MLTEGGFSKNLTFLLLVQNYTVRLLQNIVLHSLFYYCLMGIHFVMVSQLPFYLFCLSKHNMCQDSTSIFLHALNHYCLQMG